MREKDEKGWAWNTRSLLNLSCASPQRKLRAGKNSSLSWLMFTGLICIRNTIIDKKSNLRKLIFKTKYGRLRPNWGRRPQSILCAERLSTPGLEFWLGATKALDGKKSMARAHFFRKSKFASCQQFFAIRRSRNPNLDPWLNAIKRHNCRLQCNLHVMSRSDKPLAFLQ